MAQAHSQLPSRREARKAATVPDPGSGRRRRLGGLLRALSLIVLPSPPDQAYNHYVGLENNHSACSSAAQTKGGDCARKVSLMWADLRRLKAKA